MTATRRTFWRAIGTATLTLCVAAAIYSFCGTLKELFIGGVPMPGILFPPALYMSYPADPNRNYFFEAHAINTVMFGGIAAFVIIRRRKRRKRVVNSRLANG
jgi:hypothetical protein